MTSNSSTLRVLLNDCAKGFYQEMYFLGKDVLHPQGNQLKDFGFSRAPSQGLKGTSCYTLETPQGVIELYGSCAAFYGAHDHIVFIRKKERFYHWLPQERLIAGQWEQTDLKSPPPHQMAKSLIPMLEWWAEYEQWIGQRFDPSYRQACWRDWKKVKSKPPWLSPCQVRPWIRQFIDKQQDAKRPQQFLKDESTEPTRAD